MKRFFLLSLLLSCVPNASEETLDPIDQIDPPTDLVELHDWLIDGEYKNWSRESEIKIGDNGAPRRLFANEVLISSLRSGVEHNIGAVSIREMYEKDERELRGISLMQKREIDGELKWFYYETFDLEERNHSIAQVEAPGCEFCHKAGFDFIQSSISYFEE